MNRLQKVKPESHQPCDSGSLATCLVSLALCTRSRRRIAGTLRSHRASHFRGSNLVLACACSRLVSPPWSDHDGRITLGIMNLTSSELAFVPVPPGRTCVSPGTLASGTWMSRLTFCSSSEDHSSKTGTPQRADSPSDSFVVAHPGSRFTGV
jgi:hypothetical protein